MNALQCAHPLLLQTRARSLQGPRPLSVQESMRAVACQHPMWVLVAYQREDGERGMGFFPIDQIASAFSAVGHVVADAFKLGFKILITIVTMPFVYLFQGIRAVFTSNLFRSFLGFMLDLMTGAFMMRILKNSVVTRWLYSAVNDFTGGLLDSILNLTSLAGRFVRGEHISRADVLSAMSLMLKVAAIVISVFTGGTGAVLIALIAQQLKGGTLGKTAIGRTLLDIVAVSAMAYFGGTQLLDALASKGQSMLISEGSKAMLKKIGLATSVEAMILLGAATSAGQSAVAGEEIDVGDFATQQGVKTVATEVSVHTGVAAVGAAAGLVAGAGVAVASGDDIDLDVSGSVVTSSLIQASGKLNQAATQAAKPAPSAKKPTVVKKTVTKAPAKKSAPKPAPKYSVDLRDAKGKTVKTLAATRYFNVFKDKVKIYKRPKLFALKATDDSKKSEINAKVNALIKTG